MSEAIQNERRTAETRKALKLAKGRALYWSGNHSFSGERFSLEKRYDPEADFKKRYLALMANVAS